MRSLVLSCLALLLTWSVASGEDRPFGIEKRIPWTTSRVVGSPDPAPPFHLVRVLPKMTFDKPVHVIPERGTDRLLVLAYLSDILAVDKSPETTKGDVFLPKSGRDVYGITYHPNFEQNRFVYVFTNNPRQKPVKNRISRYLVSKTQPYHCDPATETVIIEWESNGHDGGDLAFGPDGYLYISAGDGTVGSDPKDTGQDLSDLLSAMIRIDVDHPEPGRQYSIPKDNPFINLKGARPEIWAYGFRNPWRFCFEPGAGRLWMGDIGQDMWEMIEIVERGSNHGWPLYEGSHPFQPLRARKGPTPVKPPLIEHHHSEARSITGGGFYTGDKFPELKGAYLYGDYATGRIWGVRYDGQKITWHKELADSAVAMLGFGFDQHGDVYTADFASGELYRLERTTQETQSRDFPRYLSDTGLFASTRDHTTAPGVVPYSVNSPLWSDGADKLRFLAVPGTETVGFDSGYATWDFPEGSVLVKTFLLPVVQGDTSAPRRIETRLLTRQQKEWVGYSYLWNDDQTDAVLVGKAGIDREYKVADVKAPGGIRTQTWRYPSRAECMVCHARAAGFVLGLNTAQMNRDETYGSVTDNQIRALSHAGYFKSPPAKPTADLPKLVTPQTATADLDARVRAYLHANCAICHVADGGGNSRMQLHALTKGEEMNIFDQKPQHETFGLTDARIIAPGAPDRSVMLNRISRTGPGRMPPLGTSVPDEEAIKLLKAWIAQLPTASEASGKKSD